MTDSNIRKILRLTLTKFSRSFLIITDRAETRWAKSHFEANLALGKHRSVKEVY